MPLSSSLSEILQLSFLGFKTIFSIVLKGLLDLELLTDIYWYGEICSFKALRRGPRNQRIQRMVYLVLTAMLLITALG